MVNTKNTLSFFCLFLFQLSAIHCIAQKNTLYQNELEALRNASKTDLINNVEEFNHYKDRPASDGSFNGENNSSFLKENIPYFKSSNDQLNKVYNYRWWMVSKHLKEYHDPQDNKTYWVSTEFFGEPAWATLSAAITCPAGHQFYELRWLRDPKYARSYADYYMVGSASRLNQRENQNFLTYMSRPESHHFSSWMVNGIEMLLRNHPDGAWLDSILPGLERHQQVWDDLYMVKTKGSKTEGLYKILDLYDGMEFSLSAVLGLIASEGAYSLYTKDNWRNYYLGWGTTGAVDNSDYAKKYPKAYRRGYPDFYLVRPSVNSYMYGSLKSLSTLHYLKGTDSRGVFYEARANDLSSKILSTLWNSDDQFFNSFSAGDNAFGVRDFEARVRESVGYTPWYFNMIPKSDHTKYEAAWDMFGSEKGFYNTRGMTTAERQHPYYNEQAYAWNGRGWPFQNSVVYKAYANYLKNYKNRITSEDQLLLYDYIEKLTTMHGDEPNIGEWYIPSDGKGFGGQQDYFHSTYIDMIIEDLIGFEASHHNDFYLYPLIPEEKLDFFYLGNIRYHGQDIDIIWKKDWEPQKRGNQSMLCIWKNGKLIKKTKELNQKIHVTGIS